MNICTVAHYSQIIGALFGISAAAVWWKASRVKATSNLTQEDMSASGGDIVSPLGKLMQSAAEQSRLNALAALLAAIAAVLSLWQAFMPTCWG